MHSCPKMTHNDQLPTTTTTTKKVIANYSEKTGMGGIISFMHQLHKTEMFPQTKLPSLDTEYSLLLEKN